VSVAYVVFSHQYPEQVLRLLRTLRAGSPDAVLVSHHAEPLDVAGVERVVPPTRVSWGGASQLEMMLRGMRHALRFEWEWLVLLSGQDYPLRPLHAIERELGARGVEGYVETVPVAGDDEFARRYLYRYRRVRPLAGRLLRPFFMTRELPGGVLVGRRATPPIPVRRGSDWLSLSRRAAELVTGVAPDVLDHFRHTILPTEALPHSVLHAAGLPLSGDTRRYTRWDAGAAHPHLLGLQDLDAMLASGLDFARKFAPGDPVLDELDRRL
jgi:hypothetical protein